MNNTSAAPVTAATATAAATADNHPAAAAAAATADNHPAPAAAAADNHPIATAADNNAADNNPIAAAAATADNHPAAAAATADNHPAADNHPIAAAAAAADIIAPAPENPIVVLQHEIEGIHDVPTHVLRHATAFYNVVIPLFEAAGETYKIIDRMKYYRIMGALLRARDGEALSFLRHEFPQIHNWNKIYAVVVAGERSNILVSRPKDMIGENVDAELVRRISYLERVFLDIVTAHGQDHSKGRTLYSRLSAIVSNIPRDVCKHFTDTCPRCIERQQRTRPTAGLRPIITQGFNVRGQVDLIDFQSMPDGEFRFLLNYIDHGMKFLFSVPIVRKRASCIALALFQIFTLIGPPMILQSDNGSEFHGAALNAR
jgi:hypothetical protein